MLVEVKRVVGYRASQKVETTIDTILVDGMSVGIVARDEERPTVHFNQDVDPLKMVKILDTVQRLRLRQGLPPVSHRFTVPPSSAKIKQYLKETEWRKRGIAPEPEADSDDHVYEETIDDE